MNPFRSVHNDDGFLMDFLHYQFGYKWNSVQNMHLIIFHSRFHSMRSHVYTSRRKSQILRQTTERRKKNDGEIFMVMIWWAPNWQRPSKYLNFKTDGYTDKREKERKKAALANILVTEKRQWNFSWKTLTKRNIWNYCRKMNLENQQKCHWANSFNRFFFICLCVQFSGSLETNWYCKLYDVWWVQHEPAKMQLLFDLQEGRSGLRSKCSLFNYEENLQKQNTNQKKNITKQKPPFIQL